MCLTEKKAAEEEELKKVAAAKAAEEDEKKAKQAKANAFKKLKSTVRKLTAKEPLQKLITVNEIFTALYECVCTALLTDCLLCVHLGLCEGG